MRRPSGSMTVDPWVELNTKVPGSKKVRLPMPSMMLQPMRSMEPKPVLWSSIHSPSGNDAPSLVALDNTSVIWTSPT